MRVTLGAVLGSLLLLALLAALTSGCASRVVYVHQGPPPLKVELKTAPPHAKAVWIAGRWAWNGHTHRYVWVAGHWEVKPKGRVWIPGHWKETPRGWIWVKGHWKR